MHPGAQVKGFTREGAEVVVPAFRVRASDTRDALGEVAAFAKLTDDPLYPFESVITVGFPVLLLVLQDEILIVPIDDFVEDGTTAGMVRLI